MSDNRNYYYLKLKDDFFDSDEMKVLESMKDGYLYSNILLKMYLRSLKFDGKLMLNERIPYNDEMLASVTGHNKGVIKEAVKIFASLSLIEVLDNGAIFIADIQNFIGQSSTEGDRKRAYRARIEKEKQLLELGLGQMSDNRPPEIDIDIDIEIEKELDIELDIEPNSKATDTIPKKTLDKIIDEWNKASEMNIRSISKNTERYRLTKARLGESDNEDEFLKMIEIVSEIPFLQKPSKYDNKQGKRVTFRPSYDWCVVKANYDKILEGAYYEVEDKESDNYGKHQPTIYDDGSGDKEDDRPSPADILRRAIEEAERESEERNE